MSASTAVHPLIKRAMFALAIKCGRRAASIVNPERCEVVAHAEGATITLRGATGDLATYRYEERRDRLNRTMLAPGVNRYQQSPEGAVRELLDVCARA